MARNGNSTEGVTRRRYLQLGGCSIALAVGGCQSSDDPQTEASPQATSTEQPGTTTAGTTTSTATPDTRTIEDYDVAVRHDETEWDAYNEDWTAPDDAVSVGSYTTETLVENLDIPWDMAFAPSGELFITERTGQIQRFEAGDATTIAEPGAVIDAGSVEPGSDEDSWLVPGGEGGLLGIAVHPTYPEPSLVYAYFTTDTDEGRRNRVAAFDVTADNVGDTAMTIVDDIPGGTFHDGGRIAFGPANYLWVTTGDSDPGLDNPQQVDDPGTLRGKVLRVEPDGSAPDSNPDIAAGADSRVYTYGHRNPQGITWLPDGTPVAFEHGPGSGDEVNILDAGADYGWPQARNSGEFTPYEEVDAHPPVADAGAWAPSGGVFYTGEEVPGLQNRLLVGGLISQQVVVVTLSRDGIPTSDSQRVHDESWLDQSFEAASTGLFENELGRVRHLEQGPSGDLYALTSNRDGRATDGFPTERDDRLLRIRPA